MAWLALVQDDPTTNESATHGARGAHTDLMAEGCRRLARALDAERRGIDELRQALGRQRAAVARNDAAALEQTADQVARAVATLGAARRTRGEIMLDLAGDAEAGLPRLERTLGVPVPVELQDARAALLTAARAAAHDVAINQHVLRRAVHAGDLFLQRLFSSMADPMPVYARDATAPARGAPSLLINRRA